MDIVSWSKTALANGSRVVYRQPRLVLSTEMVAFPEGSHQPFFFHRDI
jgi:hypothetical protein